MAGGNRERGKRGERQAVEAIRRELQLEGRRTQQYSGTEGTSDVTTPGLPEVHWEVKLRRSLGHQRFMDQALADVASGAHLPHTPSIPVVLAKEDRGPWLLTVPLDRFQDLIEAYQRADRLRLDSEGPEEALPVPRLR